MEQSNAQYCQPGLIFSTVYSRALGRRADISFFSDPKMEIADDTPVVVLLHGVYGSHWSWLFQGGVHHVLSELYLQGKVGSMILAMPSDGHFGDGSGYYNHNDNDDGGNYEKWIVEDVIDTARSVYKLNADSPVGVSGLSMGGYGALRLGVKFQKTHFQAISAHSSVTCYSNLVPFVREASSVPPKPKTGEELDQLIDLHKLSIPLQFDCGLDDDLLNANRQLSKKLTDLNLPHCYREYPGGHDWPYWHEHILETLVFMQEELGCSVK